MSMILTVIISILYFASIIFIFLFSMVQLTLAMSYRRSIYGAQRKQPKQLSDDQLPNVTVQLPLYNERYVVERLIDSVAQLDYPSDRLDIQVLDDSDDDTLEITRRKVEEWAAKGIDIQLVTRPERVGCKAGALAYGMRTAKGEFIAIFDADFLPPANFLRATISHFQDKKTGMVQTRWGHINEDYSILTRLQAFGLNGHFFVEQVGRHQAGSFINFNGTAGVWRRRCIENSGGWKDTTLTEDLDLSYRAQLRGWKFKYLSDVISPAELPVIMPAIKSQQYRWNKGGAETARLHLGHILRHKKISPMIKLHAFFHLISSSVFVGLLLSILMSVPILLIKQWQPEMKIVFQAGTVFLMGFFSIAYLYWLSSCRKTTAQCLAYYLKHFPLFLALCMGLSLHNSLAVIEGWIGHRTSFIRTPKFNITADKESWKNNVYVKTSLNPGVLIEGLLSIYFFCGIGISLYYQEYFFSLFMLLPAIGFLLVFLYSVTASRNVSA